MMTKFSVWILGGLVTTGAMALPPAAWACPCETSTAPWPRSLQVAQDVRDPAASINPERPIQIRVVSKTDTPVTVSLVEPAVGDRPLAPGQSVTFGRLHTSYLALPIDLAAYVEVPQTRVYFDVSTSGNEIIIDVTTASVDDDTRSSPGNPTGAIYVDEQGHIYLY